MSCVEATSGVVVNSFRRSGFGPSRLLFLALAGCGGDRINAAEPLVTDSAGVPVIEFRTLAPTDSVAIAGEPHLEIGTYDGPAGTVLHDVTDARFVGEEIVVSSGTEVRWFGRNGEFLRRAGERGEGPGEFRRGINHLTVVPPDTVAATEGRESHLFSPEGKFARTVMHPNLPYELSYGGGDTWLQFLRAREAPPAQVEVFSEDFLLLKSDALSRDTLVRVQGERYFGDARGSSRLQDSPRAHMAGGLSQVAVADGSRYSVTVLSSAGRPQYVIRSSAPPPSLETEEDALAQPLPLEEGAAVMPERPQLEHGPAILDLLVSSDSSIWVRHRSDDSRQTWLQYTNGGRSRRLLFVPADVEVTDVRGDALLGLWRDSLDVPHVVQYALPGQTGN